MKNYEFSKDGYEIQINRLDTPYPWVNYLTNTKLSAMISQAGGGFLWYKDPDKFRITRYRYNQLPTDTPGFYVYIKEKNGDIWCPTFQPMNDKETQRYSLHRPGETRFYATHKETEAVLSFYIPPNHDTLVWELSLTNNGENTKEYDVIAYTELSQFNWSNEQSFGYYWQHMLNTHYNSENEVLFYMFNYMPGDYYKQHAPLVYFASDRTVKSFCGDRDAFVGNYRSEASPVALEADMLGRDEICSGNPCAAIQITISCEARQSSTAHFFLGVEEGALVNYTKASSEAIKHVNELRNPVFIAEQKKLLDERYKKHFSHFTCNIPDKVCERQINIWGPLNALQFSLFHQTPQPSAPGVRCIGVRDKIQALMPLAHKNPEGVREGLLFMLSVQYTDGAIAHNIRGFMNEFGKPGKYTRLGIKSDDHLWIPFLAYSLASETDTEFLNIEVPYCDFDGEPTERTETVWQHLMRIIDFTQKNLGAHGLPLMLDGDWNDIISKFSPGGKGESVFAAQQYVAALDKMIELAKHTGRTEDEKLLNEYRNNQERNILAHAWNGKWWYRCFDDDGNPIGSEGDSFGKLWLNPQTWSIISNVGSKEQQNSAYEAVEQTLDTGYGLKLLDPGFKTYPEVSEPFSPYNPGTGENGAVFCHAHTWSIIAEAKRGNAEKAWKYYTDLLPVILHERLGTDRYKSDPYGWVSNIVGPENGKHGWGNVIRLTGTCSWMNIAATQYLLGVRTTLDGVKFDPCIPADWSQYEVQRDYQGCRMMIIFNNPNKVSRGVASIEADGKLYSGNMLPKEIFKEKKTINITVTMG